MVMRKVLGGVFVAAALGGVACGQFSSPDGSSADEVNVNRGAKRDDKKSDGGKAADDDNTPARVEGDGGKSATAETPDPADPACVTRCKESVEAKCNGEGDFCEMTCGSATVPFIECMEGATDCSKPEWIRCKQETGNDQGGEKK